MWLKKEKFNKGALLEELQSLSYPERNKKMALLSVEHRDNKEYSNFLEQFFTSTVYEAMLGLIGASILQDMKLVKLGLAFPAISVQYKSISILARIGSYEEVRSEVLHLSFEGRRRLFYKLVQWKRIEIVEALIEEIYTTYGIKEAEILLPGCNEEMFTKWVDILSDSIMNWKKYVNRYPKIVLSTFGKKLQTAALRERINIWHDFYEAMEGLCTRFPNEILEYVIQYGPLSVLCQVLKRWMGVLVVADAQKVFEILCHKECRQSLLEYGIPKRIFLKKEYFTKEQWIVLAKLFTTDMYQLKDIFHALAPSMRAEVFEAIYPIEDRKDKVIPEVILKELPYTLRHQEAKRMLELSSIKESREDRIRMTSFLPIEQARDALIEATTTSNAEERGDAIVALIRCTARSNRGMDQTLNFLATRFKNDQAPVKDKMITALGVCKGSLFKEDHLKDLECIINNIIEARDSTRGMHTWVAILAINLLKSNIQEKGNACFEFGRKAIIHLAEAARDFHLISLVEDMPKGIEKIVFEALCPTLKQEIRKEKYGMVLLLAGVCGKRGYAINELQELLYETTMAKSEHVANRAIGYWLEDMKNRDTRVKQLLDRDLSVINNEMVFSHVHHRRQEWLTPFLEGRIIQGQFLSGKTIYLIPAHNAFIRWLPQQQQSFSKLLERIIYNKGYGQYERANSIKKIAKLPDVSPQTFINVLDDQNAIIVEAALQALSNIENPEEAVPILLHYLDNDYAKVAMFALSKCLKKMTPTRTQQVLEEILQKTKQKITVRKEVVRLLGVYKNKENINWLEKEFTKENCHKDVIMAIGHAARGMLEEERAWHLLEQIATIKSDDIQRSLISQSTYRMPMAYKKRYLKLLMTVAKNGTSQIVKETYASIGTWAIGNEKEVARVLSETILNVEETLGWKEAIQALIAINDEGKVNEEVVKILEQLIKPLEESMRPTLQRDLPHRQRLMALIVELIRLPKNIRIRLSQLFKSCLNVLESEKTLRYSSAQVCLAAINWENHEEVFEAIHYIGQCLEEVPCYLREFKDQVVQELRVSEGYWKEENLLATLKICREVEKASVRWVSLIMLEAMVQKVSWKKECIDLLMDFRKDKDLMIKSYALNIWITE